MQKIIFIILLILITTNCKGTVNMKSYTWIIKQSTAKNQLFKEGMFVDFSDNNIRFHQGDQTKTYPVIVTDNRMVIETGHIKWLFEIESSDSTIFLRELYSKEPVLLTLTRINNLKIKNTL